jgi:predicted ATPase/DNA-binding winged helix-turn-helix (wHTH) protein
MTEKPAASYDNPRSGDSGMSAISAAVTYRFGEFEVDQGAYEVRRGGQRVRLARQPMDLLLQLLEHRQALVSREDIAKRLWRPDVFTDLDAGIHTAILKIRQVLGDPRESPRFIETVPGKGYRFVAPVEVVARSLPQVSPVVEAPPARLPNPPRHNLPAELTSFVGRRKELLELPRALASSRLLSLTGAGGVGKTRLAIRLAASVVDAFPDGVWLVDLAPLTSPDLVTQTIATALGARESAQRSARDALLDMLRHRRLLLVIDNCEHLIAPCAEIVEALLRAATGLRIIATSREALGVSGETVCRVPSLSLPEALSSVLPEALVDSEATQLFVERAGAADSAFTPTRKNADVIGRICRRLDGIPLAIELAAARIVVLSPEQIEARLQKRFCLLTGNTRTAVARQRTLEAAVDWSYELLSDGERHVFRRLSVFPAAWTLQAAEHVCKGDGIDEQDVLDLLSRLVSKSLAVVDGERGGERRYRFLETIREYARERLLQAGATDRLRERHFEFFFDQFHGALRILRGPGQVALLRRLRIEQENVRSALDCALTSSGLGQKAVELAGALYWFWTKCGLFGEGRLWLERALALPVHVPGSVRARALIGLAHMATFEGQYVEAGALAAEALSLGRKDGDAWVVSVALFVEGDAAFELGEHERAEARLLQAREAADAGGEAAEHAAPLLILANIAARRGDHDRAQQLFGESIEVQRRAGEVWGLSVSLALAASLGIVRDDVDKARAQASEALSLSQELEDPHLIALSLEVFAALLAAGGLGDGAARLWGASEEIYERVTGSLPPPIRSIRDRYIEPVKTSLGGGAFEIARIEGRAMPLAQAIALARQQALLLG